jgi:hypothetical protein
MSLDLFADESHFDVVREPAVLLEADKSLRHELVALGTSKNLEGLSLMSIASSDFASEMLGSSDFMVQEAAAWRLGALGELKSIAALEILASKSVQVGLVDQHIRAAIAAITRIRALLAR